MWNAIAKGLVKAAVWVARNPQAVVALVEAVAQAKKAVKEAQPDCEPAKEPAKKS